MGLDGWLERRPKTNKLKMLQKMKGESNEELAYWRKSYAMNKKFLSYGRKMGGDLNCTPIPLTKEELKELLDWAKETLKEIEKEKLNPELEQGDNWEHEKDKKDFELAKETLTKAIKETDFDNYEVYYYAWW